MGKIRQWIKKIWDLIGGDALWHFITELKRSYLGRVGVSHVLAFIGSLLGGIWGALQASIHSQPTYVVVTFFILLFAGILGIINFLWALRTKWQQRHLAPQSTTSPTLSPDELIHPPSNGVLWRWNPEIAADGPFCPTHPQERLFLKGKHGGQKWKDFDADYINHHRFTCPINQSEDFQSEDFKFLESPEQTPLRIYQLRAQATARFRIMRQNFTTAEENEENVKGTFEIEYVHSKILWRGVVGGEYHSLSNEDRVPHKADFFLQIVGQITAKPSRFIEEIGIEFPGKRIDDSNWIPERISDQREVYVRFKVPSSIGEGKHSAQLIVKALGANRGVIEKKSQAFDAVIAYSYPDLQKFSGTSHQEITNLKSKTEDKNLITQPPTKTPYNTFTIKMLTRELRWRAPGEDKDHSLIPIPPMPRNAFLVLYVIVDIESSPNRIGEEIGLEFIGQLLPNRGGKTTKASHISQLLSFNIPEHAPPGEHQVRLTTRTSWNGGTKGEKSSDFTLHVPYPSREGRD